VKFSAVVAVELQLYYSESSHNQDSAFQKYRRLLKPLVSVPGIPYALQIMCIPSLCTAVWRAQSCPGLQTKLGGAIEI